MKYSVCLSLIFSFSNIFCLANQFGEKNWIDRTLDRFGQSSLVIRLNKFLAPLSIKSDKSDLREVRSDLQKWGEEAQQAIGIPPNRRVPIKGGSLKDGTFAVARYDSITINKTTLAMKESHGIERCNMYHEAVHIKYNDATTSFLVNITGLITGLVGSLAAVRMLKPTGKLKLLYPVISLPNAVAAKNVSNNYYRRYTERRADSEGHYATKCHICVHEKAKIISSNLALAQSILGQPTQELSMANARNYMKTRWYYLSADENKQIASILRQENKICPYHQKNKLSEH